MRSSRLARAALLLLLAATSTSARRRLLDGGYGIPGTVGGVVPQPPPQGAWLQAPGQLATTMSSCTMSELSGQCKSTMAPVFAPGTPLIDPANYPAIAKAYIAATSWFCSQFSNDTCAWPCQFNLGVGCTISGHLFYQPWTCPYSVGFGWNYCSQPPQQTSKPQCLSSPMCSWNNATVSGPTTKCSSTFASTLTDQQKLFVFGSLYFSTMPRELHGCCKGSTYSYQLDNFCNAAFSNPDGTGTTSPEDCAEVPGCAYDPFNVEGCYPTPQAQVGLQFAYKPRDALAAPLKKLAGECDAITDAATCNNYKPVAVDPAKISYYLDRHMVLALNQRVTDQICPLPSVPPPWV